MRESLQYKVKAFLLIIFSVVTLTTYSQTDYALSFDGVNDYISIPNGVAATFTLEARIKTSATSATGASAWQGNVLYSADISGGANDYVFSILNNKLAFDDGNSGTVTTVGTTAINDGAWHHVAVVRTAGSPGTVKLYIDGVQNGSTGVAGSAALTANATISIGGTAGKYFTGYMDELRVWNSARTATEINTYKNTTLVGNEANLYKYLNLNDGTGSTASNLVSGQTDGTLTNMTTAAATSTTATSGWVFVNCTGLWSGAASTNWATAGNWCSGVVPTSTTDVVIPPVATQPTISSSVSCSDLTINSGAALTTSSAGTLNITGNITNSGTMTNSGTTNFNGTSAQTFSGITTFNNLILNNAAGLTLGGSVTVNGNLTITSGTLSTNNNNMSLDGNFTNNGGFTAGTGRVTFIGTGNNTVTGTSSTAFNTITVNKGTDYNNIIDVQSVITMASGGLTLTNGTFKVSGNSTITPFTSDITSAPYRIPSTAGLWVNGGTVSTTNNVTSAGLIHASGGTLNIADGTDEKLLLANGAAVIADGGTVNIAGRLSYNLSSDIISFTISSGTFNVGSVGNTTSNIAPFTIVNTSSSFTMSGGTIVIMKGGGQNSGYANNAATSNVTGGTLQIGSAATLATDTIQINSTPPVWNLTINSTNAPVAQLTNALVVYKDITISGGKLLSNNFNLTVGGNWTNNGAYITGTETVTFNGTTSMTGTAVTNTFNNLTVAASSTVTSSSGITGLVVNGTLTTGASASLDLGTTTILSGTLGTISNSGTVITSVPTTTSATPIPSGKSWGGTIDYANAGANQTVVGGTYNNLTVRPGNAKIATASGNIVVNGALYVTTAFGAFDLSTYVLSGTLTSINNQGDIRTSVPTTTSATPISSGKTWGGTIYYNAAAGAQTVVAGSYNIFVNNNTSGVNTAAGDITVTNQFKTTAGGTLDMGSLYKLINGGTVTNNGTVKTSMLTATGTAFPNKTWGGTGTVEYAVTGGGQTVAIGTYNNLKLDNTSGTNTLSGNVTLNGVITLSGGTVTTGSYIISLASGASLSRSSGGHVIGNLKKNVATGATNVTFEIGDATNYTPATVAFASVTTAQYLTATTTATDHPSLSGSGIRTDKSVNRYFTLTDQGIVFTTATLTMNWVAGDVDAGATTSSFVVANYNSSAWTFPTTASPLTTSVQATGLTSLAGAYTAGQLCVLSSGFSYAGSPYCSNAGTASPTITGTAGTFTSTAGLSINAATGVVNLSASTAGTYTVTNSASSSGGCTSSSTAGITISVAPSATISYAGTPYCYNCGTASVTPTGTAGGTYTSSPAGLSINSSTGAVALGSSTAGTYTVTYTIAASGGCSVYTTTASITITAQDSDGDGIPDITDVDDDNDGIPDVIEVCGSGATSFSCLSADPSADSDGDGIVNYRDANFGTLNAAGCVATLDSDGDGIPDFLDRDSDNDGIPDVVEAFGADTNGDGIIDNFTDTDGDGLSQNVDANNTGAAGSGNGLGFVDYDGDGVPNTTDLDSDNDGIPDIREALAPDTNNNGRVDGFTDTNGNGLHDSYENSGALIKTGADTNSDGKADSYPNKNADLQGYPNPYDLDSDGDGIVDVIEFYGANYVYASITNGKQNGTRVNGWSTTVSGSTAASLVIVNTDGRGPDDYLDADSDDDGISDNVEAQSTSSYKIPTDADTDNDGIADVYEVSVGTYGAPGLTPYDHDADGTPDYIDSDSDNDGAPDINEASKIFTLTQANINTADTDGDGMVDQFDNISITTLSAGTYYKNVCNSNMGTNGDFNGPTPSGSSVQLVQSAGTNRDFRNASILPITLVSFSGMIKSDVASVTWKVENEAQVNYYVIERSTNGAQFDSIGMVKALNRSTGIYNYNDALMNYASANVYYKIKQVNKTGEVTYSQVIILRADKTTMPQVTLYPNPAHDQININLQSGIKGFVELNITNAQGKVMIHKSISVEKGANSVAIPEVKNFTDGLYLVIIKTQERIFTEKIVVE